jgi:hypothetical protein
MDHSPWLVARMCSSISRMSSKEDVLVVPPAVFAFLRLYRSRWLTGHILNPSQVLSPLRRTTRINTELLVAAMHGIGSSWLDRIRYSSRQERERHLICCTQTSFFQICKHSVLPSPLYLIPFEPFLSLYVLICMAGMVANCILLRFNSTRVNNMKWNTWSPNTPLQECEATPKQ